MQTDILVTHPYKHHVLNLAAGCAASGLRTSLAVPFYRKGLGSVVALAPGAIGRKARGYHHDGLGPARIEQSPAWQIRKLASFLGNPRSIEGPYDRYVAAKLLRREWSARIVVTLQDHMPETSAAAKKSGALLWSDQIINLSASAMARIDGHSRALGGGMHAGHSEESNTRILSRADIITVPSGYTRQGIAERIPAAARVYCVPYGVDAGRFDVPRRAEPGFFTVVVRANLIRKGGHLVLETILRSHQQWASLAHPRRLRFHFLGACEPALAELFSRVSQLTTVSVQQGDIPAEDVPALFSRADCFLMPTLSESMSLACVEAMQAGLPLLITEFAGIDRFVPGEMGLLIEDNVASIEAAITRCLANPGQLARWSEAARGAAANLSWRDYECAIAAICRDALGVAA